MFAHLHNHNRASISFDPTVIDSMRILSTLIAGKYSTTQIPRLYRRMHLNLEERVLQCLVLWMHHMSGIKSLKGLILGSSLYSIVLRLCGISSDRILSSQALSDRSLWHCELQRSWMDSTLSKKHDAICHHQVREIVAAGWI